MPADYPDEIFYGKGAKGKSVLMTLDYLKATHYPAYHRPLVKCSPLARKLYELVRIEPMTTPALRKAILKGDKTKKAAFAKALVELQVTLNIVRCNAPEITSDACRVRRSVGSRPLIAASLRAPCQIPIAARTIVN